MTTDDLRTRARAEADRRWPLPNITDPLPSDWHDKGMASGFVLGALWHAAQQPTREQIDVDELARVVDQAADDWDLGIGNGGQTWEHALARAVVEHLKKGTRTMSEYVPSMDDLTRALSYWGRMTRDEARSAIAAHDRQVKAEAWDEGVRHGEACDGGLACDPRTANPYRIESQETP